MSDNGGLHRPGTPNTPATHNTPFRAGKGYCYEGGLRVPSSMRWVGKVKAGAVGIRWSSAPTGAEHSLRLPALHPDKLTA